MRSATKPRSVLDDYLSEKDAAVELDLIEKTLAEYRKNGIGPKYAIVGRRILYSRAALAEWLANGGTLKSA